MDQEGVAVMNVLAGWVADGGLLFTFCAIVATAITAYVCAAVSGHE